MGLGCVGMAGVVSFIKREFNGAGYCDEGKNGLDDSDVGDEDNGCSKCNGTVRGPAKLRCSVLPRGADADDVLVDGRYGHGTAGRCGCGWRARVGEWRVTGDRWCAQKTGSRWWVAGDG